MTSKVRKAVVPAAGLGTRFLPVTKTVPKEMLPIVDRPLISFVVEEAVQAGVEQIILIAGRGKTAIEDFFDHAVELEGLLDRSGRKAVLDELHRLQKQVEIVSVRQQQALGLGHAVLCAEKLVGDEPFAVLLGDEIMRPMNQKPLPTQQLIEHYSATGLSAVAVMPVEESQVNKYGIIKPLKEVASGVWDIDSVVEKPSQHEAPSKLALPGRYVFSHELFKHLHSVKPGRGGEIQLTDGIAALAKSHGVRAVEFSARRFDAGDKLGYLQANIELGLEHPDVADGLRSYLKNLAKTL
jgi:UTP--glucose-1-phosphate uridylyltransferase